MLFSPRHFMLGIVAIFFNVASFAQTVSDSKAAQYIAQYKDLAMAEMQRSGVPASITLAQGLLESSCGCSPLATKGNNHFGIKCNDNWNGKTMSFDDDQKNECFRCYESVAQSFRDHSDFLRSRDRYAFLFDYAPTDYKKWAYGLKQAGYATNPKYPQLLIENIEKYNLAQYDVYDNFAANDRPQAANKSRVQKRHAHNGNFFARVFGKISKSADGLTAASDATQQQRVLYVNHVKAVRVQDKETLEQIGKDFGIGMERLLGYNDLIKTTSLPAGSFVFLQPKRRDGDSLYHVVQPNETMFAISQSHGIKLQQLYLKNRMEPGTQPATGEVIFMQDQRTAAPLLAVEKRQAPAANSTPTNIELSATNSEQARVSDMPKQSQSGPNSLEANASSQPQTYSNVQADSSARYITSAEVDGVDYYTVKPKDTLYGIAHAYHLSVDELREMNKLGSEVISSGMRLRVRR